jgi:D-alanyl-D-alanine carboxypeptidase
MKVEASGCIPMPLPHGKKMKDAARTVGISLYIVSAFRSFERQSEIIEQKREKGLSEEDAFKVSAPPGFSEHNTGRAVDINLLN